MAMLRQLFKHSKPSCLLVSSWYENKCFLSFNSQTKGYPLKTSWQYKAWMQECTERTDPTKCHLVKTNIIPLASALCFTTLPPCTNRLLESRSTTLNASLAWVVKCSLEMATPTRSLNAPNSSGQFEVDRTKSKYRTARGKKCYFW